MEPMTTAWPGRAATAVDFEAADVRRFGTYSWPYGTARGRASADACAGAALAIRGQGVNGPALRIYGTGRIGSRGVREQPWRPVRPVRLHRPVTGRSGGGLSGRPHFSQ